MVRLLDMTGNQSPTSISRTIEKVFDDSQYTGEVNLSGRKLKDYPFSSCKYDLIDTTLADLSKNRFIEIPIQVCHYYSLEQLNCYHNVIKSLPQPMIQLQNLVHLNLSRNQLSVIPPFLCQLEQLQVLLVNNNRLVSLPEEICQLQNLMELDVSCNEITHLPIQLGELASLKCLSIRRNLLVELPIGLCRLKLCKLDFSCNRIAHIPCDFHKMETLEELCLENNPLISPPAHACTRGIVHIMKFLNTEALKDERRRGVIQNDVNMRSNLFNNIQRLSSLSTAASDDSAIRSADVAGDSSDRFRQNRIDSGYNTTDSGKKSVERTNSEERRRQKADYESRKKKAELLRLEEERKRMVEESSLQQRQSTRENGSVVAGQPQAHSSQSQQSFRENHTTSSPTPIIPIYRVFSDNDYSTNCSNADFLASNKNNSFDSRRPSNGNGVHQTSSNARSNSTSGSSSWSAGPARSVDQTGGAVTIPVQHVTSRSCSTTSENYTLPLEEELRRRHDAVVAQHRREALNVRQRLEEEKQRVRQQTCNDVDRDQIIRNNGHSSSSSSVTRDDEETLSSYSNDSLPNSSSSFSETSSNSSSSKTSMPLACQKALDAMSSELNSMNPIFTIRRSLQHVQQEREQIEHLRRIIETLLKLKLLDDLPFALRDGVVLCHLANHVRPRTVPTIHVPSPAVPNLSLAKCRRNVENFLLACRRLGVDQEHTCSSTDILEQRGIFDVAQTVRALINCATRPQQSAV